MSNIIAGADGRYYSIGEEGLRAVDVPGHSFSSHLTPPRGAYGSDVDASITMFRLQDVDDMSSSATMWFADMDSSVTMFRA